MSGRQASGAQAKTEATGRRQRERQELEGDIKAGYSDIEKDRRELARRRGAFATKYRSDVRAGEREWAAVKKEFKIKGGETKAQLKETKIKSATDRYTARINKKIADAYTRGNKAKAKALVRQAELQYKKGKLPKRSYVEIRNHYSGLPEKGVSGGQGGGGGGGGGAGGRGSGAGGSWAPWERTEINKVYTSLVRSNREVTPADRKAAKAKFIAQGGKSYLFDPAWRRYKKKHRSAFGGGKGRKAPKKTGGSQFNPLT